MMNKKNNNDLLEVLLKDLQAMGNKIPDKNLVADFARNIIGKFFMKENLDIPGAIYYIENKIKFSKNNAYKEFWAMVYKRLQQTAEQLKTIKK